MWKTTDRYVQQKRVKAVESEQKLKQVYVPDYSKAGLYYQLPSWLCKPTNDTNISNATRSYFLEIKIDLHLFDFGEN